MIFAFELAGFFAAHAIWSLAQGEGFIPICAFRLQGDERKFDRLVVKDSSEAAVAGRQRLDANPYDAEDAALLYDAIVRWQEDRLDALIIEMRAYFMPDARAILAIPYTPASSGRFLVHRPKFMEWVGCVDFEVPAVVSAFFEGVGKHQEGARLWKDHLDESR